MTVESTWPLVSATEILGSKTAQRDSSEEDDAEVDSTGDVWKVSRAMCRNMNDDIIIDGWLVATDVSGAGLDLVLIASALEAVSGSSSVELPQETLHDDALK